MKRPAINVIKLATSSLVIVGVAITGTVLLVSSHAATPGSTTPSQGAVAGANSTCQMSGSRPAGKSVPACGDYVGTSSENPSGESDSAFETNYVARETLAGRTFDIDNHFPGWVSIGNNPRVLWDMNNGRIPMVSWDHGSADGSGNLSFYTDGGQDSFIRQQADLLKATGKPIMLRFLWEMNGSSSPWTGIKNNDSGQTNGPAKYIAAWRHVHDIFEQEGATNVIWVWCPQSVDTPGGSANAWNHWTNYYPGDSYVDWVGIDAYSYGTTNPSHGGWQELAPQLQGIYNDYAARKPIMIAETSASENAPAGDSKAAWIGRVATQLQQNFPAIAALVWFDRNEDGDFPFDTSQSSLTAFRTLAAMPYYNPLSRQDAYTPTPTPTATLTSTPRPTTTPTPVSVTPNSTPTPTATQKPDLVVTDVSWTPADPKPNDHVIFSASVKNQGAAATASGTSIDVSFSVDGKQVSWSIGNTTALAAGASIKLTANGGPSKLNYWSTTSTGIKTVEATVDNSNNITESNENNNELSKQLLITAAGTVTKSSTVVAASSPVVTLDTKTTSALPIKLSAGTKLVIPTTGNQPATVKLDNAPVTNGVIDTSKLVNGQHTVTVTNPITGKTSVQKITVHNPFFHDVANRLRNHALPISAGLIILIALATYLVIRFQVLSYVLAKMKLLRLKHQTTPTNVAQQSVPPAILSSPEQPPVVPAALAVPAPSVPSPPVSISTPSPAPGSVVEPEVTSQPLAKSSEPQESGSQND